MNEVEVSRYPRQEKEVPEQNLLESRVINGLLYLFDIVTYIGKTKKLDEKGKAVRKKSSFDPRHLLTNEELEERRELMESQEFVAVSDKDLIRNKLTETLGKYVRERSKKRSLLTRARRAELYRQVTQIDRKTEEGKDKTEKIIKEARIREKIAVDYLNQGDITVDLPIGKIKGRYNLLIPPASQVERFKTQDLPPIFLIPGISQDIDPMGGLVQELAFRGRTVITVGYPEASLGEITEEFAQKAENTAEYKAHSSFFAAAFKEFQKSLGQTPELWGHSTGCPIIVSMLKRNSSLQKDVPKLVLIAPASSINQGLPKLAGGMMHEGKKLLNKTIGQWSFVMGRKNKESESQTKMKGRVFNSLIGKISHRIDCSNVKIKDGGEIIVWHGGEDKITSSIHGSFNQILGAHIVTDETAGHMAPIVDADRFLDIIFPKI